jgi:hypothetical protein
MMFGNDSRRLGSRSLPFGLLCLRYVPYLPGYLQIHFSPSFLKLTLRLPYHSTWKPTKFESRFNTAGMVSQRRRLPCPQFDQTPPRRIHLTTSSSSRHPHIFVTGGRDPQTSIPQVPYLALPYLTLPYLTIPYPAVESESGSVVPALPETRVRLETGKVNMEEAPLASLSLTHVHYVSFISFP